MFSASNVAAFDQSKPRVGVRQVDVTRGGHDNSLSSQWYSRPEDQRFLTLRELYDFVNDRADRSHVIDVDSKMIRAVADENPDHNALSFHLPNDAVVDPTHWSFGQVCSMLKASDGRAYPAGFLRALPAKLAAINLQWGFLNHQQETMKLYWTQNGRSELRAVTSPTYGRILDKDVVSAIMPIAEAGEWKVPGVLDWKSGTYDPNSAVTRNSTTLYASDRDVFVFLCRDQFPIEVGKLRDGSPDMLFPGFIVANSETGSRALSIESMYLRAVCMNRNLWGVEDHSKIRIVHSSGAPDRFAREAAPALERFSREATGPVIAKVMAAKSTIVATDADERYAFLKSLGVSRKAADQVVQRHIDEEGGNPKSVWDFVQGLTAHARDIPHQNERVELERLAGGLMNKVAA